MKGKLINILKVVIPLAIGVYVIWYQFTQLTKEQLLQIKDSFAQADYFWVVLSVTLGLVSHLSRAYRWKYTLEPLGYQTKFLNNFFAVMIGYVANMILPRFGEVWRCVMVSRYENLSFEKVLGTVVAERVADMIVLLLIIVTVVVMQLNMLRESIGKLLDNFFTSNSPSELAIKLGSVGLTALVLGVIGWRILTRSQNPIVLKVRNLLRGLIEGVMTILTMKQKWAYLAHTIFIWVMYLVSYYVPFLALPDTSIASSSAVLASFIMASFSIILVQGGIGVYPIAVAQTLTIYSIPYEAGFAMGWIIWVVQTMMVILFGILSLILMPIFNSKAGTISVSK